MADHITEVRGVAFLNYSIFKTVSMSPQLHPVIDHRSYFHKHHLGMVGSSKPLAQIDILGGLGLEF